MLGRALLTGAVFGFVECALLYGLGTARPDDAAGVVLFGLAAFGGLGLLLAFATARVPGLARWSDAVLLIAPVAVFAMRGHSAVWPGAEHFLALTRWAPALLLVATLWLVQRRGTGAGISTRFFASLSLVAQALAGATAALRAVDLGEIRNTALREGSGPSLGLTLLALLLSIVAFTPIRRLPRAGLLAGLVAVSSVLLAVAQGSSLGKPFGAHGPAGAIAGPASPSVMLVVLDTVRADHLSLYGYGRPTTPNLERLAKRATVVERAYTASPYTLAAHGSLFTGRLPSEHGAHPIPYTIRQDQHSPGHWPLRAQRHPTLAETLRSQGYSTGAVVANYALLAEWTGLARGFQVYQCRAERFYGYVPSLISSFAPLGGWRAFPLRSTWRANAVAAAAMDWFSQHAEASLLFLNLMDAHDPWVTPAAFAAPFLEPGSGERESRIARYDAEIAFIDSQLGILFDWLDQRGLLDPMLVIVTSDHGELLGERGRWGHGKVLYETTLRVPLVIKLPYQNSPSRLQGPFSHLRIAALIDQVVNHASLSAPAALQENGARSAVLAEHWIGAEERSKALPGETAARAIYSGSWKLIQRLGAADELYDLSLDPEESRDLFTSDAPLATTIRQRLLQSVPDIESTLARADPAPTLDELYLERLRSLGYLGSD